MNTFKITSLKQFPTKLIVLTAILNLALVLSMGFEILNLTTYLRSLQELHFPITEQSGLILNLDEKLTLVTYLKSTTGDLRWGKEYEILSASLKFVIEEYQSHVRKLKNFELQNDLTFLNRKKLDLLEDKVLNPATTKEEASRLLTSPEYIEAKQSYQENLFQTVGALNQNRESLLLFERNKAIASCAIGFVTLLSLFIPGFFLMRRFLKAVKDEFHTQKELQRMTELQEAQKIATAVAHQAGMAEIATGILHNIGNILNSVNVGAESMQKVIKQSSLNDLLRANDMLARNLSELDNFLLNNPKGKLLPQFYLKVGELLRSDFDQLDGDLEALLQRIQLIKDVIASQQTYAKGGEYKEELYIADVMDTALTMQLNALVRHDIQVEKKYGTIKPIIAQKAKLVHVLLNLVKNAKEAMVVKTGDSKKLIIEINEDNKGQAFIKLIDNGVGIVKENLSQVFNHGFTTKKSGHGFGLHYCANALTEMGGKISVESEGLGKGCTFTIFFLSKEAQGKGAA